jgi:hypothetical protein
MIAVDDMAGDPAEDDARLPSESQREHGEECGERHHEDLRAAEAEHDPAHRHELRQAELEADREHEEHHAVFGEMALVLGIGHQRERVGADEGAHGEIAEDRRHREAAEHHHHGHRGCEQDQGDRKCVMHGLIISS